MAQVAYALVGTVTEAGLTSFGAIIEARTGALLVLAKPNALCACEAVPPGCRVSTISRSAEGGWPYVLRAHITELGRTSRSQGFGQRERTR
jgi:hypothetical protein